MKYLYVADDGTQFDNEDECKMYELENNVNNCDLVMLDYCLDTLNSIQLFEDCFYINIKTTKDYDILYNYCNKYGLYCPSGVGNYFYDTELDEWLSIDNKINMLREEIDKFNSIKNMLENE